MAKTIRDYKFLFGRASNDKNKQRTLAESFAKEYGSSDEGKVLLEQMSKQIGGEKKEDIGASIKDTFESMKNENQRVADFERNAGLRSVSKKALIDKFKEKLSSFSEEELDSAMEEVVIEASRIYGSRVDLIEDRDKYQNELVGNLSKVHRERMIENNKALSDEDKEALDSVRESEEWANMKRDSKPNTKPEETEDELRARKFLFIEAYKKSKGE